MQFVARAYNNLVLNQHKGTITKTSKVAKLADEINYYQELPEEVKHLFPRVVDSTIDHVNSNYELTMEYYPFPNVGQMLCTETSMVRWDNFLSSLGHAISLLNKQKENDLNDNLRKAWRKAMYVEKTEREYDNLRTKFPFFQKLCNQTTLSINGKLCTNFDGLWSQLRKFIADNYCTRDKFTVIHGDMCFANILCGFDQEDNATIKFVDPRGSFGGCGTVGDVYYDLAKLRHSVHGNYELIINDQFKLSVSSSLTDVSFVFNPLLATDLLSLFNQRLFSNYDELKIKMLEGLIFISMCARHYDSEARQIVMYCTGVQLLNKCLEEINE